MLLDTFSDEVSTFTAPAPEGPLYSRSDFLFDAYEPPRSITIYGPRFATPDPGSLPPP